MKGESKETNKEEVIHVKTERDYNEYENDIQIKEENATIEQHYVALKEENESFPGSSNEENYLDHIKIEICSDDADTFRAQNPEHISGKVVFEEVDEGSSTRKRKLNEVPQEPKNGKQFSNFLSSVAPSTSLYISNEGNKTSICNRKVSGNEFLCHMCQFKCAKKEIFDIHLRKHTGEKAYLCDLCDYGGIRKHNLISHIQCKHTMEKKFSCHICQYKCVTNNKLTIHLRKHSGEKPYVCELCDYRCAQKSNLKDHVRYKHTKEKNFSCHICQYKCVTKGALNKHSRMHTGEKPFVCELCDYRSSHKTNLKDHIQYQHTKIKKNFSCDMCQYKCSTNNKLTIHLRKHTGEKPYLCKLCDYRCSRKNHLKDHVRYKHTEEKNFTCHMCEYKSVTKGGLNRHLRTHRP